MACDGPLACHAIQGCLHRYMSVCAANINRGGVSHQGELEDWFAAVLDAIIDCLGRKGEFWLLACRRCAPRVACITLRNSTDSMMPKFSFGTRVQMRRGYGGGLSFHC